MESIPGWRRRQVNFQNLSNFSALTGPDGQPLSRKAAKRQRARERATHQSAQQISQNDNGQSQQASHQRPASIPGPPQIQSVSNQGPTGHTPSQARLRADAQPFVPRWLVQPPSAQDGPHPALPNRDTRTTSIRTISNPASSSQETNDIRTPSDLGHDPNQGLWGREPFSLPAKQADEWPPFPVMTRSSASTSKRPPRRNNPPCSICFDPPDSFPIRPPTNECTHQSTVCAACLEQHISHAVLTDGSTTVPCPEALCGQTLEYDDVIRGAKNDKLCLARYETLLLRRMLENEPNFVWCKVATCGWGQVHESGDDAPIVICQTCQARSCFTHDVPWHTDLTCDQYDTQQAEQEREAQANIASEEYIQQNAKVCPNEACKRKIEKIDGCDHMVCRRPVGCGHEFCWACLAEYAPIRNEGNHHHKPDCRHYAAIDSRVPWLHAALEGRRLAVPIVLPPAIPVPLVLPPVPFIPLPLTPVHRIGALRRTLDVPSTASTQPTSPYDLALAFSRLLRPQPAHEATGSG
ncbi:hypothetical protein BDV93DRAFT_523278 [Ceratobasidium sp. AG-I]|nr:hypothetical protein BDV93DRAFT_523278 [Ceratobasidium sp. AG-I]